MPEALALSHMPTTIGGLRSRLTDASEKLARTQARMKKFAQENEARIEGVMRGVEVVGGAAAVAYVASRYSKTPGMPLQIAGFDADLVIGGGLFAAGLFELGGKYNAHLYDLGAGGLACYATREAWKMGGTAAAAPAVARTAGVMPPGAWNGPGAAVAGATPRAQGANAYPGGASWGPARRPY